MRTICWQNFAQYSSDGDVPKNHSIKSTATSLPNFGHLLLILIIFDKASKEVSGVIQGPSFGDPEAERRLIGQLLGIVKGNNTRPESLNGRALEVNITLTLFQLIEVNQRLNMVTLSGSLTMEWIDPRMSWDPAANANIQILHLPYTSVWKPDIYAYFGNSDDNLDERMNFMVRLNASGKNLLELPFRSNSLCPIDVKLFPFDIQQCALTFGSWSYENKFIEFSPNTKVDLENFYDNQEWLLDQTTVTKSHLSSLKAGNFSTVKMTYRIRRQSFYYIFNLVIPATVVTVTSVIGIHAPTPYRTPRSSRFQLGIVTLLPMGVLLLTIVNDLPKFALTSVEGQRGSFSGVPLLGIFYLSQILTISISTITYNLFVALERYGRQGHAVPWLLTWLLSKRDRDHGLVKGWYHDEYEPPSTNKQNYDLATNNHHNFYDPITEDAGKGGASDLCANSALLFSCIPNCRDNGGPNEDQQQRIEQQSVASIKNRPPRNPTPNGPTHATRVAIRRKDPRRFLVDERSMSFATMTTTKKSPPTIYHRHSYPSLSASPLRSSTHNIHNNNKLSIGGGCCVEDGNDDENNAEDWEFLSAGAAARKTSGETRRLLLYEQWEIVIGRLERISLLFFMIMSAGILLMFFFHGWR